MSQDAPEANYWQWPPPTGPVALADLRTEAESVLRRPLVRLVSDGAATPGTDSRARAFMDGYAVEARYLTDVHQVDCSASLFGTELSLPLLCGSVLPQSSFHVDGELAVAGAVAATGTAMVCSLASAWDIAEVADRGPCLLELPIFADRSAMLAAIRRAEEAGCRGLCLALDWPTDSVLRTSRAAHASRFMSDASEWRTLRAAGFEPPYDLGVGSIAEVEWILAETSLPVVVGGVLRPDDARACVEAGAAGVVVSGPSAGLVDGTAAAIEALAPVREALGDDPLIIVSGMLRRGLDVYRALSLGADFVSLRRPVAWALAARGEAGVKALLERLRAELSHALASTGVTASASLQVDHLVPVTRYLQEGGTGSGQM